MIMHIKQRKLKLEPRQFITTAPGPEIHRQLVRSAVALFVATVIIVSTVSSQLSSVWCIIALDPIEFQFVVLARVKYLC